MSTATDLLDDMNDILGENAEPRTIRGWLDTGIPELNMALSGNYEGGFPMGRCLEIFGQESSGKTFIATMAMISAQRKGGIAFFADHERSFAPEFAESLGLDLAPSKFRHIYPMTCEECIDKFVMVARKVREKLPIEIPCVWVIDSIASMIPAEVMFKRNAQGKRTDEMRESDSYNMRDNMALASATSKTFKLAKLIAEDYNFCLIMLNQLRTDPTVMFGNSDKTPGGKTPAFVADIRLSLGKKDVKDDTTKQVLGFEVTAKAIKNKIYRPHQMGHWFVEFLDEGGVCINPIKTNLDYAIRLGVVEKSGAHCVWRGKKMFEKQLIKWLQTNEADAQLLLEMIKKPKEEVPPAS